MPQLNINLVYHKSFFFVFFFLSLIYMMYAFILPFVLAIIKFRQYIKSYSDVKRVENKVFNDISLNFGHIIIFKYCSSYVDKLQNIYRIYINF